MHLSNYTFVILALVITLFVVVQAHTQVYNAGTNNVFGADFQYQIKNDYNNGPIKSLTNTDLRCRSKSAITGTGVDKIVLNAGEDLDIRWRHFNNTAVVPVMSRSHFGPCMIYMAPLSSQGDGDVWFKIYEDGWDASASKWCTVKVIDNYGYFTVTIPKDIPSGDYLVRAELLALHQASIEGGAQFYPNCLVVTVNNGAGTSQPQGYAIPGIYSAQDPGILYNRKSDPTTYKIPGPAVFTAGTTQNNGTSSNTLTVESSSSDPVSSSSSTIQQASTTTPTPTPTQGSTQKCIPRPRGTNKCRRMRRRANAGWHVEI